MNAVSRDMLCSSVDPAAQRIESLDQQHAENEVDAEQQVDVHVAQQEIKQNKAGLQHDDHQRALQVGQADAQQFVMDMPAVGIEG